MEHTKEELAYLMKFYQIKKMPIYYKGNYVGEVNDKLEYSHSHALSYLTHSDYAIEVACEQIDGYVEAIKKFKSKRKVKIKIDAYDDYKYKDTSVVEGTYDSIFESIKKTNNRLRYCNGYYYKFNDKKIEDLYHIWGNWISESRSMDLYYGNGVVD